jgi:hypothetical protein
MTLEEFIDRIDGFVDKKASEQIPYLGYFLVTYQGRVSFTAKDIEDCFSQIRLPAYSNISSYLSKEQKAKRLLKAKVGYILSKKMSDSIANDIGEIRVKAPSDNLFPIDIFDNTRDYVKKTARQAILCYDYGLYDGCLVMIRRLIETLIIELFEHRELKERILDKNNNYLFCGDLIDNLLNEKKLWTIGRNAAQELPKIKKLGDLSAHNRRFNAKKSDIDSIKTGLRVVLEELVHLVNYEQHK